MALPPLPLRPSRNAGRDVTGTIPAFAVNLLFLRAGEFEFILEFPEILDEGTGCIELVKEELRPMFAIVAGGAGGGTTMKAI